MLVSNTLRFTLINFGALRKNTAVFVMSLFVRLKIKMRMILLACIQVHHEALIRNTIVFVIIF